MDSRWSSVTPAPPMVLPRLRADVTFRGALADVLAFHTGKGRPAR